MRNYIIAVFLLACCGISAADMFVETFGRCAFFRNEQNAKLAIDLTNRGTDALFNVVLSGTIAEQKEVSISLEKLNGGMIARLKIPVETRLKTGKYSYRLNVTAIENGKKVTTKKDVSFWIVPMPYDFMPVALWRVKLDYKIFKEIGFTHGLEAAFHRIRTELPKGTVEFSNGDEPDIIIFSSDWKKKASFDRQMKLYDDMLVNDFRALDCFYVPCMREFIKKFPRYGRDGKPRGNPNMEVSNEKAREFCRDIAEKTAEIFKDHPAFDGMAMATEIRDNSNPSFGSYEPAAFKKFAGFDIPPEVEDKKAPHYSRFRNFPLSRVIPENIPLYVYYRWFWKEGDGWNPLHTLVHESYKKHIKRPFWTFFDPAVRVPPVWGSGGKVDCLNHWTYAYPDPINVGANTSELQAMAAGQGQKVTNMTQLISYRSATAPIGQKVANEPGWVKGFPKASYITLAPDLLQEAVWTQLSRHVAAILFHGYESLVPDTTRRNYSPDVGYQCTNLQTKDVLSNLLHQVVRPLGPVLKRIPERKAEVAILESFASSVFADRGSWGWRGWIFDANLMLMWANLSPAVVYEETLLRDGFKNLKVLVMPHCDVLTEPVFQAIQEFQRKGGILVADEHIVPGITPDISIQSIIRSGNPKNDKEDLQNAGAELRKKLAGYYQPYSNSSDKDILTWIRSDKEADYLFVINDKRTFGDYLGQYGLVMEKGLPNQGKVMVNRSAGAVYDLVQHHAVPFESRNGVTTVPVKFNTNDGRLLLILPKAVGKISLNLPESVTRGKTCAYEVKIMDVDGKAIQALLPIQITVKNADGVIMDDSTFAAMQNGSYKNMILPPLNEKKGNWLISVTDLASGKTTSASLRVD